MLSGFLCQKASTQYCIDDNLCHINVQIINVNSEPSLEALNFCSTFLRYLGIFPFFLHLHTYRISICSHHMIQVQTCQVVQIVSPHLAWHLSIMLWLEHDT